MTYRVTFNQFSPDPSNSGISDRSRLIWEEAVRDGKVFDHKITNWSEESNGMWSRTHVIKFSSSTDYDTVYADIHSEGPIRTPGNYIEIIEKIELND